MTASANEGMLFTLLGLDPRECQTILSFFCMTGIILLKLTLPIPGCVLL